MPQTVNLSIDQNLLLWVSLLILAVVGLRRGVSRELLSMVGIGVAMFLAGGVGMILRPAMNQINKLFLAIAANPTDLAGVMQRARQYGDIIPANGGLATLVTFVLIVLAFYAVGQRSIAASRSLIATILGGLAGAINGFLVAYYLFPVLASQPEMILTVPHGGGTSVLNSSQTIALVVLLLMALLIAFGLYSARSGRR